MGQRSVKGAGGPTRRDLLGAAALAAMGLRGVAQASPPASETGRPAVGDGHADDAAGDAARHAAGHDGASPAPQPPPRVRPPWWLQREPERARVAVVRSRQAVHGSVVDRMRLWDLLDRGLRGLTGAYSLETAWRDVLEDAQRIVLKFNSVAARVISTSEPMAKALLDQLGAAGYASESIALVEGPAFLSGAEVATRPVSGGWDEEVKVGEQPEQLAAWLCEADAVVNVAFCKTHQIAGYSGALKNISHAVVRSPARYHANGCSPAIPQIFGLPSVASRVRLNLVNALRVVFRHGPEADESDVSEYGGLLLGFDPVAVDHVASAELMLERRRRNLPPDIHAPHLAAAAAMGLGRGHPAEIERVEIDLQEP